MGVSSSENETIQTITFPDKKKEKSIHCPRIDVQYTRIFAFWILKEKETKKT